MKHSLTGLRMAAAAVDLKVKSSNGEYAVFEIGGDRRELCTCYTLAEVASAIVAYGGSHENFAAISAEVSA